VGTKSPLISVIIPVYNRQTTVEKSIESVERVLENTQHETIVVDDGSTDESVAIVTQIAQRFPNVRLIGASHTGQPSRVRNTGIRASKGSFIAFQDSDDEWTTFDMHKRLEVFDDSSVVLSYANARYQDGPSHKRFVGPGQSLGANPFVRLVSRHPSPIPTPTVIVRRETAETVGLFNESLTLSEDYEFWLKLATQGAFHFTPEVYAVLGRDGSNISFLPREQGDTAVRAHEESNIQMFNELKDSSLLTPEQKELIMYRVWELKAFLGRAGTEAPEPEKPNKLSELDAQHAHSTAGRVDSVLKILTLGNKTLHAKVKTAVQKLVYPFRKVV
jgi:glycosyltransferase involved in cell wall biosynthesis